MEGVRGTEDYDGELNETGIWEEWIKYITQVNEAHAMQVQNASEMQKSKKESKRRSKRKQNEANWNCREQERGRVLFPLDRKSVV